MCHEDATFSTHIENTMLIYLYTNVIGKYLVLTPVLAIVEGKEISTPKDKRTGWLRTEL